MTASGLLKRLSCGVCLACLSGLVQAVDLSPYDVVAPVTGVTAGSVQVGHRSIQGDVDFNGVTLGSRIDQHNVSVRVGRSAEVRGFPVYAYATLSYIRPELGDDLAGEPLTGVRLRADEGLSDLGLAAAVWPYVDRDNGRFVGVAAYAILPTGQYDASRTFGLNLNPGNNRFAGVIQTGFHQRLGDSFDWSIAADAAFFEDNDRFIGRRVEPGTQEPADPARLEVEPYLSYQTTLAWRAQSALSLAVSLYADRGGESRVDGGDWRPAINRERYGLWALVALSPRTRVNFSYKSTINDRGALELQDNVQVRLIRFF